MLGHDATMFHRGDHETALGAVMLIASANISNLLRARAMIRRQEIRVRLALGGRLVRRLMIECLLFSVIGSAVGLLFALNGPHPYARFGPRDLIPGLQRTTDLWRVGK